jgi:hypothetical protein
MTQNKMVQSGSRRHQENKKELARNQKEKFVGGKKQTGNFLPNDPYIMEIKLNEEAAVVTHSVANK